MKIIAELGVNWDSIDQAKEMIKRSKEVGCFASKFQLFTPKIAPNLPKHLYLTFEQAKELVDYGKSIDQIVFFTPMYTEAVDFLDFIEIEYYKIRNKDKYELPLISKIYHTHRPTFISIDHYPHFDYKIQQNKMFRFYLSFIRLAVVPKYPAKFEDYSFLFRYGHIYACKGLSDHTSNTRLLELCLKHGKYKYFEKHVCLTKDCLESKWSITFDELEKVIKK